MRPHGLSGEVIVDLSTNRPERLEAGSRLVAEVNGARREIEVVASRRHQHRFLVTLAGISSREEADGLRQAVLLAEPVEDDDSLFVHDLIGSELFELDGTGHGRVASVQENPASDLLVGEAGWLVPLRFVVSTAPGRIVVDVPAGLFE